MVFHFFEPETSKASEKKKKRKPNMFISYRNEMLKYKPYNMPMSEFSKLASEWWKKLSKDEKVELQKIYQINRDRNMEFANHSLYVTNGDNFTNYSVSRDEKLQHENYINAYQMNSNPVLIRDCFLTDSPSERFLNDDI